MDKLQEIALGYEKMMHKYYFFEKEKYKVIYNVEKVKYK